MAFFSPELQSKCISTIAVLLVVFHAKAELASYGGWSLQAVRSFLFSLESQDEAGENPNSIHNEKKSRVRRMVDDVRVQNFKSSIQFCTKLAGMSIIVVVFIPTFSGRYLGSVIFVSLLYGACIFAEHSKIDWTHSKITALTTAIHVLGAVRVWNVLDQGAWFQFIGHRAMFRMVIGVIDMNCRRAAFWNVVFVFINTMKHSQMSQGVQSLQHSWPILVGSEIVLNSMVYLSSYLTEMWITARVQATIEVAESHDEKHMASHLLSAFCDGQVKLGSDLRIIGNPDKLSHILAGPLHSGKGALQGSLFSDYLAVSDRVRFEAFISKSSSAATRSASGGSDCFYERPKTLPSALHVNLLNSSGRDFPAEIFHSGITVADGESCHLIGICVDSREEFLETQPSAPLSVERASSLRVPQKSHKSSISSSSNSSRRRASLIDFHWIEKMEIEIDPFDLTIHNLSCELCKSSDVLLRLQDCMLQPCGSEIHGWIQDNVQTQLLRMRSPGEDSGEQLSPMYGSMMLSLPQLPLLGQRVISAKAVWLDFEDIEEWDEDEWGLVTLRMEGIQGISGSARQQKTMSTIEEQGNHS